MTLTFGTNVSESLDWEWGIQDPTRYATSGALGDVNKSVSYETPSLIIALSLDFDILKPTGTQLVISLGYIMG